MLWRVLINAYRQLGFDQIDDEVFRSLVAARIVEPTSKLDTVRVLGELGMAAPHVNTLYNCLRRCVQRGLPRPAGDGLLDARVGGGSGRAGDV